MEQHVINNAGAYITSATAVLVVLIGIAGMYMNARTFRTKTEEHFDNRVKEIVAGEITKCQLGSHNDLSDIKARLGIIDNLQLSMTALFGKFDTLAEAIYKHIGNEK